MKTDYSNADSAAKKCRQVTASSRPVKGHGRIQAGASNTKEVAGNLPDSEVFSCPESFGFGRDGLVRKAGRMATSMLLTSRPPVARSKAADGSQSQVGAETMTKLVNTPPMSKPDTIARQQAIESALSAALFHIRQPNTIEALWSATGRTSRALTLLKNACAQAKTTQGRA